MFKIVFDSGKRSFILIIINEMLLSWSSVEEIL